MIRCEDSRLSPTPWLVLGAVFLASGSSLQACGLAFLGLGVVAMLRRRRVGGR